MAPAPVDGPPAYLPPGWLPSPDGMATIFHAPDYLRATITVLQHADPDSAFPCDMVLSAHRLQECERLASGILNQGGEPQLQLPPDTSPRATQYLGMQVVQLGTAVLLHNLDGLPPTLQLIQQGKVSRRTMTETGTQEAQEGEGRCSVILTTTAGVCVCVLGDPGHAAGRQPACAAGAVHRRVHD